MRTLLRYFLICLLGWILCGTTVSAQSVRTHEVQSKETLYGISRQYGITIDQLVRANPGMEKLGYELKAGDVIVIPVATEPTPAIRLGVMLPLHKLNNDGRRMTEYYRGVLMACDSLKKMGMSVDIHAWNLPDNGDVKTILSDPAAAQCDMIIGPLYSRFMTPLSEFVEQHNILLVVPFSIQAPEVFTNRQIFQVYQMPNEQVETTARRCVEWFKDYHPIIIDCADSASTKGPFTSTYRRLLEVKDIKYSLTSLKSSEQNFTNAFVKDKPNLVILNTARSPELLSTFGRLSAVKVANPDIQISMFGYTEWMMYTQYQLDNFYKYNVFIPAPFYTNNASPQTTDLQSKYRRNFNQEMMIALPRFALTGFDHAMFFLRGYQQYGKNFDGAAAHSSYQYVQTPLKFERIGNGGLLNRAFMFVHYKPDHTVETINY